MDAGSEWFALFRDSYKGLTCARCGSRYVGCWVSRWRHSLAGCDDNLNAFEQQQSTGHRARDRRQYVCPDEDRSTHHVRSRDADADERAVVITGLQSTEVLLGMDIRPGGATPGQLYALSSMGRRLHDRSDDRHGDAEIHTVRRSRPTRRVRTPSLTGTEFGIDFNPVVDRLRVVSDTGLNLRINVDNGAVTNGRHAERRRHDPRWRHRARIHEQLRARPAARRCSTSMRTTNKLLTTSDPNNGVLTEVGALGIDASALNALDISVASDGTNTATGVFTVGTATNVYTINLTTGAATLNGAVTGLNANEQISRHRFRASRHTAGECSRPDRRDDRVEQGRFVHDGGSAKALHDHGHHGTAEW